MKYINKYKKAILCFVIFIMVLLKPITIPAASDVGFWSDTYVTETGSELWMGFRLKSDRVIVRFEADIEYDSSQFIIKSGAEIIGDNLAHIERNQEEIKNGIMFLCTTNVPGIVNIKVSNVKTYTLVNGVEEAVEVNYVKPDTVIGVAPNNECLIEKLTVNGNTFTEFNRDRGIYNIDVDSEVDKLDISADCVDNNAVVTIKNADLEYGKDNQVTVNVTNNGKVLEYILNVNRKNEETSAELPTENPTEESTTKNYQDTTGSEENTSIVKIKGRSTDKLLIILIVINTMAISMLVYVLIKRKKYFKLKRLLNRKTVSGEKNHKIEDGIEYVYIDLTDTNGMMDFYRQSNEFEFIDVNLDDDSVFSENAVSVRNVSMDFKIAENESSSFKEFFINIIKRKNKYRKRRVLSNVSFDIRKGEVVGIIGTNGSGKSTILKIISGVLKPTEGKVYADFKKIQLLTLGTGFDKELTAKENVYLNGAIIGYSKEYIDSKYDEIVKFAELEGFMDEKIKNFSTGMVSRLGFAIATVRETPEILILDEVLSVGDMYFRQKSEKRIKQMIHSGSTVIIVSHSSKTIMDNCSRAIWLERGVLKADGRPRMVCRAYETMIKNRSTNE